MCRPPRYLHVLPLLLVVAAISCSQAPRMSQTQETDYVRMLRQEFFETHPDGMYNEHIKRGEVVKGMDFLEVLASWGNPDARKKPMANVEHWTYVEIDEDSKDAVEYRFIFRQNVLAEWELSRQYAKGGVNLLDGRKRTVLTKGEQPKPAPGTGTNKKN